MFCKINLVMIDVLKDKRKLAYLIHDFDDCNLPYSRQFLSKTKLIKQIVNFFKIESQLIYPAKSYFVAIIYAKCLEKYFKQDFYQSLDDIELLPDDPDFIPYSMSKDIYDIVLREIGDIWKYKSIEKTVNYFKQEFLIL